jgi:hypothetical protein
LKTPLQNSGSPFAEIVHQSDDLLQNLESLAEADAVRLVMPNCELPSPIGEKNKYVISIGGQRTNKPF